MSRPYRNALTPSSTPGGDAEGWARARQLLAQLTSPSEALGSPRPPAAADPGVSGADRAGRTQAPSQPGLTGSPPEAVPLVLTRYQLLSPQIEDLRRDLLAWHRNRWETRESKLAELLAWYTAELDSLDRRVAELEAAELYAESIRAGLSRPELQADTDGCRRKLKYARARVRSLREDLGPRAMNCQREDRWIRCSCEGGAARPVPVDCRQRTVCEGCRKRWAIRMKKRILEAAPRWIEKMSRGRRRARVRMITLTVGHSGDLARDRADLVRGWEGLRKQLHKWFGEALPFCMVWETTPGTGGEGHVHAHVIIIGGPGWWSYAAIQRTWRNVCPRSSHLDIATAKASKDPRKAAGAYLFKYATKGADLCSTSWSESLIAQTIAAHYGKRWITTSARFWVAPEPICKHCGERCQRAPKPNGWVMAVDSAEGMLVRRTGGERAPPYT